MDELSRHLKPKEFNRWVHYFHVKELMAWENRDKWEYYAADILHLLYCILKRVDGMWQRSLMSNKSRKDFLIKFKTDLPKVAEVSEPKQFKRKSRKSAASKKKDADQYTEDQLCLWAAVFGAPEIVLADGVTPHAQAVAKPGS